MKTPVSINIPSVKASVLGGEISAFISELSNADKAVFRNYIAGLDTSEMRPGTYLRTYTLLPLLLKLTSAGGILLDIGGFDGILSRLVFKHTSIAPLLIDLDWEGLRKVINRGVIPLKASALTLPFPDESFNLVWALDLLEHLTNPADALREINRILKPSGRCLLTTPIKGRHWNIPPAEMLELHRKWGHVYPGFAPEEIAAMFAAAKLPLTEISGYFNAMTGNIYHHLYVSGDFKPDEKTAFRIWTSAVEHIESGRPQNPLEYILLAQKPHKGSLPAPNRIDTPAEGIAGIMTLTESSLQKSVSAWADDFKNEYRQLRWEFPLPAQRLLEKLYFNGGGKTAAPGGEPRIDSLLKLKEFCAYLEENTSLYEMDYLGFPWYRMAKDSLSNAISENTPAKFSPALNALRRKDFLRKLPMLKRKYDYVFFEKAKMRRRDPANAENLLYADIYTFMDKLGKSFIIFEEPSGEEYDGKYLQSSLAARTIPYEIYAETPLLPPEINIDRCQLSLQNTVEKMFGELVSDNHWSDYVGLLKKRYLQQSREIPGIIARQHLLKILGARALFGGMGTHLASGLNNDYAVVEIGHGFPGKIRDGVIPSPELEKYDRAHFRFNRFFSLMLSTTSKLAAENTITLAENHFNFGMPELRRWLQNSCDRNKIRTQLRLADNFTVLVASTGWIDYPAMNRFLQALRKTYPAAKILLRPHPTYDNISKFNVGAVGALVMEKENKYDLFAAADVVLSSASSMALEAQKFTDNVLIYPDRGVDYDFELDFLRRQYPGVEIILLENIPRLLQLIEGFRKNPSRKLPQDGLPDYERELQRLLEKIDRSVGK